MVAVGLSGATARRLVDPTLAAPDQVPLSLLPTHPLASRLSTFSAEAASRFDSWGIHEEEEHDGNNVDDDGGDFKALLELIEKQKRMGRTRSLVQEFSIAPSANVDGHDDESMPWGRWEEAKVECRVRVRRLVQEFSIEPSANCSIKPGGMSAVGRWLTELGVGWVLSLDDVASAGEDLDRDARSWIRALDEIAQTICFMWPLFPHSGSVGLPSMGEEDGEHVGETCSPDRYHLLLFIQETITLFAGCCLLVAGHCSAGFYEKKILLEGWLGRAVLGTVVLVPKQRTGCMLKMLRFVDVIVALDTFNSYITEGFLDPAMAPLYNKLIALLGVHDALSEASKKIISQFALPTVGDMTPGIPTGIDGPAYYRWPDRNKPSKSRSKTQGNRSA